MLVGVLTRLLAAGRSEVRALVRAGNLSLLQNVHTGSGVHPASCSVGTGFLPGDEAAREWADHLTSAIAQIKNERSNTSSPPECLKGVERYYFFAAFSSPPSPSPPCLSSSMSLSSSFSSSYYYYYSKQHISLSIAFQPCVPEFPG